MNFFLTTLEKMRKIYDLGQIKQTTILFIQVKKYTNFFYQFIKIYKKIFCKR